jgi:GAF domain-containing protein
MQDRPDIADALAQAAREINTPADLDSTLSAIVEVAARSLPGIDHVGVSIAHRDGRVETKAGTGPLVWQLDQLQYELGEGPCVYAVAAETVVVANDIRHEQRWPRYVGPAVKAGLRAQMGLCLYAEEKTLGGLNLYATAVDRIDPEVEHAAELFAVHAALALGRAWREEGLNTALQTRKQIGQAIGIVMQRFQIDEDSAFHYLARVSQHSNVKLRDVAQELVQQANDRARTGALDGARRVTAELEPDEL